MICCCFCGTVMHMHSLTFFVSNLRCGPTASDKDKKERNIYIIFFNDALNTFYLQLYGIGHMVKDHSDSERKPADTTWAILSD